MQMSFLILHRLPSEHILVETGDSGFRNSFW